MNETIACPMARRSFVGRSLGVAAGIPLVAFLEACASLVTRTVTPVEGKLQLALAHFPELAVDGGSLRVRPSGTDEPIYVLALGGGRFVAVSPICTHLGCTVEIQSTRLVCPCHGSTYDREGRVLQGPAEKPLTRYATTLTTDDVLVVDLGART
jgi:Rieske Fe-S protein